MEQLFITVMNMSLTAGIVILLVMLFRLFLRRQPKIFSYLLWTVVLFRLLCPVSFSSGLSLLGVLPMPPAQQDGINYIPENVGLMERPEVVLPVPVAENSVNAFLPPAIPENSVNPMQILLLAGMGIWVSGIIIMTAYGAVTYWKLHRKLRTAVKEKDNIYYASGITTPFVCGLFCPRIYLPEQMFCGPSALGEQAKQYILLHEQIHIRRRDYLWRIVSFLTLCIHWFNPLVWLAFILSGRDMEMSCDEAVIRKMGDGVKKEYSAFLLTFASGRRIVLGIPLAFGEGETGGRIKNVLRYKKPAQIAFCIALLACLSAIIVLAANPKEAGQDTGQNEGRDTGQGTGENASVSDGAMDIYYGIVSYADSLEETETAAGGRAIIRIPGIGDVEIPEAEEVYPYIEIEDFQGPEAGDLVELSFPKGEMSIQETYPAAFSIPAKSIVVMGQGFSLEHTDSGKYLFTVPWGLAQEAREGDRLEIYRYDYDDVMENGQEKEFVAAVPVLFVDIGNYDVWVELSADEVNAFLAGFGRGIACELVKRDTAGEEGQGMSDGQPIFGQETTESREEEQIRELSENMLSEDGIPNGTYRVYARSLSRSAGGIDRYVVSDEDSGTEEGKEQPFLAFSEECKFYVNRSMNSLRYEQVSFEEFADLAQEVFSWKNPSFLLTFEKGMAAEAILENDYGAGISYAVLPPDVWSTNAQEVSGLEGTEILGGDYTLKSEIWTDIGDGEGMERVRVYSGNVNGSGRGVAVISYLDGRLLYTASASADRTGWNHLYIGPLGSRKGGCFLMTIHIEDRDDFGEYAYYVFRLSEDGGIRQLAGSSFQFDDKRIPYDDALFKEWADKMGEYLSISSLLLSTQDGELRTTEEVEQYSHSYETLRRQ